MASPYQSYSRIEALGEYFSQVFIMGGLEPPSLTQFVVGIGICIGGVIAVGAILLKCLHVLRGVESEQQISNAGNRRRNAKLKETKDG